MKRITWLAATLSLLWVGGLRADETAEAESIQTAVATNSPDLAKALDEAATSELTEETPETDAEATCYRFWRGGYGGFASYCYPSYCYSYPSVCYSYCAPTYYVPTCYSYGYSYCLPRLWCY